jgi:hypothetical protein
MMGDVAEMSARSLAAMNKTAVPAMVRIGVFIPADLGACSKPKMNHAAANSGTTDAVRVPFTRSDAA